MANGTGILIGGSFVTPPPPDLEAIKKMEHVHTFDDGSGLVVSGDLDENGLPVAYIAHPEPIVPVDAHPRHPGIVVRPGESRQDYVAPSDPIPHVTRVPVAQVVELMKSGVIAKPEKKEAA